MQSRVYAKIGRPSVCPVISLQLRHAASLLLSARQAGDIDQQQQAPALYSAEQQMRAVSRLQLT